jgi:GT2 family glycosyltransferase
MPLLSVIIVNYNAGDRLARAVEALRAQTMRDFEVLILDNASTDGSLDLVKAEGLDLRILPQAENLGFAAGNNIAVKEATGQWLAFLNPDAYAEPNWLEEITSAIARYPGVEAFGSTQLDAEDPSLIDGAGDCYSIFGIYYRALHGMSADRLPEDAEVFAPCAAAAIYSRARFEALGGFDERFFCYGEDVDLGFRHRLAGGRCVQLRQAVVHHEGSGITGKVSEFTVYHGHRNRIWVAYKNLPPALYRATTPLRMAVDRALARRFAKLGLKGAYSRALKDGYGRLSEFTDDRERLRQERKVSVSELLRLVVVSPAAVHRHEGKFMSPPEKA